MSYLGGTWALEGRWGRMRGSFRKVSDGCRWQEEPRLEAGVGAGQRRSFAARTLLAGLKRSPILIMRWRYNLWVCSGKEEPGLKGKRGDGGRPAGCRANQDGGPGCELSAEVMALPWSLPESLATGAERSECVLWMLQLEERGFDAWRQNSLLPGQHVAGGMILSRACVVESPCHLRVGNTLVPK